MQRIEHLSGESLEIDDASIYFEITGNPSGPVFLLLHGGFGNAEDFNPVLAALGEQFKVIGVDSRGQGKSTLGSGRLTYERIQQDVIRILEHLGVDTLSILGFSDGGIVAYRLASLTSLKIERLVTIGSRWHLKYAEATRDLLSKITAESWKKRFPATFDAYQRLNLNPDFERLVQSIINMWLDPFSSGYPNEAVGYISSPLLVVRGDDDHLVSRESVVELSGLVKNSRLLNIPYAGHAAYLEQPEIFNLVLGQFFERR